MHADLNRSELFDTIWAVSTNIDTLAMLPQLWMMSKVGGQVPRRERGRTSAETAEPFMDFLTRGKTCRIHTIRLQVNSSAECERNVRKH